MIMLEIAVIADDLTGAADTGIQFCPSFPDMVLMSHENLPSSLADKGDFPFQGLALYTNTRSLKADLAGECLKKVGKRFHGFHPKWVYKKVDSCLRGNIGAEVEALMDQMGYDISFISPAFPDMGRTTFHDIHLVNGIPVAETELSKDPVTPVTTSRLSEAVGLKSHSRVGHVDLRFLEGDEQDLIKQTNRLVLEGARHLVFDVTRETHLDRIVGLALGSPGKILLVGSAGLAGSLARFLPKEQRSDLIDETPMGKGTHLLVCGTASERTALQISRLARAYPCEVISLPPDVLADPSERKTLSDKVEVAQLAITIGDVIIHIRQGGTPSPGPAESIVSGMASFVAAVLEKARPASLFLTGGDTAHAVLDSLGAGGIRLSKEIVPGMVLGRLVGGTADGIFVVTKAGAFGRDEALIEWHQFWENRTLGAGV